MPVRPITGSGFSSLPTPKARDAQAEGYEAGLRRSQPQVGTIVKAIVDGDERITMLPTPVVNDMGAGKTVERWDEWTAETKAKHNNGNGHGASLAIETLRLVDEDSLLRTPSVTDSTGGAISENQARERGRMVKVADQAAQLAAENGLKVTDSIANSLNLLPTPLVDDSKNTGHSKNRIKSLASETYDLGNSPLLPTVTTQDGKNTGGASQFERNTKPLNTQVLVNTEWGKFEPAIRRWEQVLDRPAPAPTKPDGKDGAHRLSSKFTEWMMGLPDGWITDCGLSRNEELKACGNGVVPQQAELALRMLLDGIDLNNVQ